MGRIRWIAGIALALAACGGNPPLSGGGSGPPITPVPPVPPTPPCRPQPIVPQRIERLTLLQEANAVGALLSSDVGNALVTQLGLAEDSLQFFPPLESTREGDTIIPDRLTSVEVMAGAGGQYVFDHFADVTGCDADVDCVRAFVSTFAERAYRRPLSGPETDSLNQEMSDLVGLGSGAPEIAQYGVYAVLMAPGFLYTTELGDAAAPSSTATDVALTPYELATHLAFMLTNAPPDAQLLDAAKQGTLATDEGVGSQVDRLLAIPAAQRYLSGEVSIRLRINLLANVVIDPVYVPAFSQALEDAMATESRMFLDEALWRGRLGDLMTSTTSFVNTDLAETIYGIAAPTGATSTDFVRVELPVDQRAGVLTRAAFTTSLARTDIGSVFARSWAIADRVACDQVPPPPDSFAQQELAIIQASQGMSQEAQARQRLALPECNGCHVRMDPYGLALDEYDIIGRIRTQDEQGRPIDTATTLPPAFDNQPISNGVDLSRKIAQSHTFTACFAQSFLHFGLPNNWPPALDSCVVNDITSRFAAAPGQTFGELLREVARSPAMTRRLIAR